MKPVRTLVIVASEARARLWENRGIGKGLVELQSFDKSDFADSEIHYSDTPGRSSAARDLAVHAVGSQQSERDQMREAFAARVLDAARRQWNNGRYDRLAMAAPPKMLGSLRKGLDGAMARAPVVDLNKDLVAAGARDLAGHFENKILF